MQIYRVGTDDEWPWSTYVSATYDPAYAWLAAALALSPAERAEAARGRSFLISLGPRSCPDAPEGCLWLPAVAAGRPVVLFNFPGPTCLGLPEHPNVWVRRR